MKKIFFYYSLLLVFCFHIHVGAQSHSSNYKYELIKMDSTYEGGADLTIETYLLHLKQEKDKKMGTIIGVSREALSSFSPQSPLSNLLVDMLFDWGNDYLSKKKIGHADFALLNFGGIRASLPQGNITVGDIYQISPFENTVSFVFAKGSELQKMFDSFSEKRNAVMANVKTVYMNGKLHSLTVGGMPLESDKIYIFVTINFLAFGGDDFLRGVDFESVLYLDAPVRDIFIDEIAKRTAQGIEIESNIDDRVKILPSQ